MSKTSAIKLLYFANKSRIWLFETLLQNNFPAKQELKQ